MLKLTKKEISNVPMFFPEKTDIVSGNFSYIDYIKDVNALRHGILQGYLEDFPSTLSVGDAFGWGELLLNNETQIPDEKWDALISKIGDYDIVKYDNEIFQLHNEFAERILVDKENPEIVDKDISFKMFELATRNEDGTHNPIFEEKKAKKR